MAINKEDVLRVAELAHLELTPDEVEMYRAQLDSILSYIGKLNELNTANVQPMAGGRPAGVGGDAEPLRDDEEKASKVFEDVAKHAPDVTADGRYIRVPKVIER